METIRIDIPDELLASVRSSPETVANEIRFATALRWYADGRIDLQSAAQLAGVNDSQVIATLVHDRLSAAGKGGNEMAYARELESMTYLHRTADWNAAIEWVRSFKDPEARGYALSFLAGGLEEQQANQLLTEVRQAALAIPAESVRSRLLAQLAARLTNAGQLRAALAAADAIGDERSRVLCLVAIAPSFPVAQRAMVLDSTKSIQSDKERQRAVTELARIFETPGTAWRPESPVQQKKPPHSFCDK